MIDTQTVFWAFLAGCAFTAAVLRFAGRRAGGRQ